MLTPHLGRREVRMFAARPDTPRFHSFLTFVSIILLTLCGVVHGQTLTVLHSFTGGLDGAQPSAGLSIDRAGNLYGTTSVGGVRGGCFGEGCGTVYKLAPRGSGWIFTALYDFTGGDDGAMPMARVMIGSNGSLYGTTFSGGNANGQDGYGVAFNLKPPAHTQATSLNPWKETVLYRFRAFPDGNNPFGDIVFDSAGAVYGITTGGGFECESHVHCGTVYKLTQSSGWWTESIIYQFTDPIVALPQAGVILDQAGNVYGTTSNGPGAVYQLAPSGSGWTEHTLYEFSYGSGPWYPLAGVILDPEGNLLGTTQLGGQNAVGTVFELTPSGGNWTANLIYSFTDGGASQASLVRDAAGNLYGTTCGGGPALKGSVFKLTPSGGGWTETDLYDFTGAADGSCPLGNVILDSVGNIYGTTVAGGLNDDGVVFEIAQ